MAIYHLNVGHVSRSTGRSSVQSAAYITGSSLYETRRDLAANYENRSSDIVWSETIAPSYAPIEYHDSGVWDKLESFEDEYAIERFPENIAYREKYMDSARVAMTIVVALPRELSSDVSIELVKEFIASRYTSQGLIVTAAMHDDEGNPHAHIQVSRRSVNADGSFSWAKNREMCTKKELLATRKVWAELTNQFLEREGFETRITEKSFADLGVHLIPSQHRGWISDKLALMGVTSRIVGENETIFISNKDRILRNPDIILNEITSKQATFTQIDMLKVIQKRIGNDSESVSTVFEQALVKAVVLGDGIDGISRYTSSSYMEKEKQALAHLDQIMAIEHDAKSTHSVLPMRVEDYLHNHFPRMSDEQYKATLGLLEDNQFAVLIGRAGTGKTTTTMKATAALYQEAGYNVIGTSLSALAAENLGIETSITSKTVASWLSSWDRLAEAEEKFLAFDAVVNEGFLKQLDWYNDLVRLKDMKLTAKSVLMVDEAGMIGTESWHRLLNHATKAGAKVIAVGDDHQYKAIEAGDFFREMTEKAAQQNRLFTLTTIWRQRVDWMRQASHCLAELNSQAGLSFYEQHEHIHQTDSAHLEQDIAQAYIEKCQDNQTGLVLAFRNAQVDAINGAIRSRLRREVINGTTLSSQDVLFIDTPQRDPETHQPLQKGFAIGDKIVFLKNDKQNVRIVDEKGQCVLHQSIKNGTLGILEKVSDAGDVVIRLDSKDQGVGKSDDRNNHGCDLRAQFNIKDYSYINHGYALTTHKSQGQTVDFTLVAASKAMDAKSLYVAMTRHRDDAHLFYAREDFADFKALSLHMSRFHHKDLAKDYTIRPENTEAFQRVQEYQQCIYDGAAILRELHQEGDSDLTPYLRIKKDQIALGREIFMNYDAHKLYLNQAGITAEMLHVSTGLKPRPLSIAEEQAKMTVALYGEAAQLSKELWHIVRHTTPLHRHPDYEKFQSVRLDRDDLAKRILDNYPLHREFVKLYSQDYFISKRTMEKQVAYRSQMEAKQKEHSQAPLQHHGIDFTFTHGSQEATPTTIDATTTIGDRSERHQEYQSDEAHPQEPRSLNKHFSQKRSFEKTALEIKQELTQNVSDIALHFLGQPQQKGRCEWRYGKKGSISIHVQGAKKGLYSNFESGVSGNVMKLIEDQLGVNHIEAFKWGANFLGYGLNRAEKELDQRLSVPRNSHTPMNIESLTETKSEVQTWTPIYPAPCALTHITFPDLHHTPQLRTMMRGRTEVGRFVYEDENEQVLGYVVRLEDKKGNKITPTLTYCQNDKGEHQWRWKGFGDHRPLYGLAHLKQKPQAPVLIVEGEKTCEAARKLFPDHAVVTWSGGCGAVHKTDWSVLIEREVTIWPDHDKAGINAALKIGQLLEERGHTNVKCVDLPSTLPHKWDLADVIPTGVNINELLEKALSPQLLTYRYEQEKTPRFEKIFTYTELKDYASKNSLSFALSPEREPLSIHIANQTYKELKTWYKILNLPHDDEKMMKQAALTGIYTAWSKAMLDTFKKENYTLDQSIAIGAMAAKSKMAGDSFKKETDRLLTCKQKFLTYEDNISLHVEKNKALLQDCPVSAQESLVRTAYRCHSLTGYAFSHDVVAFIVKGLQHLKTQYHTPDMMFSLAHIMSDRRPHQLDLTHDHVALAMEHQQFNKIALTQAVHLGCVKEKQRERTRGLELTL